MASLAVPFIQKNNSSFKLLSDVQTCCLVWQTGVKLLKEGSATIYKVDISAVCYRDMQLKRKREESLG
jgi:hypothetical protein